MDLPQELIDKITCNLASDIPSLHSCSLVAKSWIYPSRRWLFKDVLISGNIRQRRWLDRISPTNIDLLRNIRSFTHKPTIDVTAEDWSVIPPYRIDYFRLYLPSLCQLERLGFFFTFVGPDIPQNIGLFSTFQHTLSSLCLSDCHATSSALVTLVDYFPLLANLELRSLKCVAGGGPVPRRSRPLRGRLVIADCMVKDRALFNQLSNPPPELDELSLCKVKLPTFYNIILGTHGGSTKRLKMTDDPRWQLRTSRNRQVFPMLTRNINPR